MSAFNNLKIGTKIIAGYVVALILMIIVGGGAIVQLSQINIRFAYVTGPLSNVQVLASDMVEQIYHARLYANKYIFHQNPADLDTYTQDAAKFKNLLGQADVQITDPSRVAQLGQIKTGFAGYTTAFDEVVSIMAARQKTLANIMDVQGPLVDAKLDALRDQLRSDGNLAGVYYASQASDAATLMRVDVFKYLVEDSADLAKLFEQRHQEAVAAFRQLDPLLTDSTERQLMADAKTALEAYAAGFELVKTGFARENDLVANQLDVLGPNIRTTASAIQDSVQKEFDTEASKTNDLVNRTTLVMMVVMIVAMLAGLTLGAFISRSITAPLGLLVKAAGLVSKGDLLRNLADRDKRQIRDRGDEIGEMGKAFTHMIDGYIQPMAEKARQIAGGDLSVEAKPYSDCDELGNAFAEMLINLRYLVGQVAETAASVNAAAGQLDTAAGQSSQATQQITQTIQQIASGTLEQSESVTKTVHSVEEMKCAIDGVAKGAQEQAQGVSQATAAMSQLSAAVDGLRQGAAAQAQGMEQATVARASLADALQEVSTATEQVVGEAQQAAQSAAGGAGLVTQTVESIQQVRLATEQLAERVRGLGHQSAQIGMIIETIEDIASQTNLLALNAAIEAARAGAHGKGFAVVADEVRKLAERSSAATKEIAQMIRAIQKEASEAVEAMGQAAADVSAAVKLTNQAGTAFRDIAQKSQGSASRMLSVREAVGAMRRADGQLEQAVAEAVAITERNRRAAETMSQLNKQMVMSLDTVSAVVEENTASTEEMAAGSSEVTRAIESIASVSEENSAAFEEVSAAAEETRAQVEEVTASAQSLVSLAQTLQELVAQFRLNGRD